MQAGFLPKSPDLIKEVSVNKNVFKIKYKRFYFRLQILAREYDEAKKIRV